VRNSIGVAAEISVECVGTSNEGVFLSDLKELSLDLFDQAEFRVEIVVVLGSGSAGELINKVLDSCVSRVHDSLVSSFIGGNIVITNNII